jgi:hypothetical protein
LQKAVGFLKNNLSPVVTDLLYCNGNPVLNRLVVRDAFKLTSDSLSHSEEFWRCKMNCFSRFLRMRPFRVDIEMQEDKKSKTAVAGIVVTEHRKSSLLARLTLNVSSISNGMMHAFFIKPRRVSETLFSTVLSLWQKSACLIFAHLLKQTRLA